MSSEVEVTTAGEKVDPLRLLKLDLDTQYFEQSGDESNTSMLGTNVHPERKSEGASYLVFRIGERQYACEVSAVDRVAPYTKALPIPFIHNPATLGFSNYDGSVAPLLDLNILLRVPPLEDSKYRRIVYLNYEGFLTGIPTTSVEGVHYAVPRSVDGLSHFTSQVINVDHGAAGVLSIAEVTRAATEEVR